MDIWDLYHSGQDDEFREMLRSGRIEISRKAAKWASNIDDLFRIGEFENKDALTVFIKYIEDPYVGDKWLSEVIEEGRAKAPSPFGEGSIEANTSHYMGVNKLIFLSQSGEKVIVFQSITSVDIVYFPVRGCYLPMKHPPIAALENYVAEFSVFAGSLPTHGDDVREFGGLLVSHFFPFHFYSEALPAYERIHSKGLLQKVPAVIYREGGVFVDMKAVWPAIRSFYGFSAPILADKFYLLHGTVLNQKSQYQMIHAENAYAKVVARSMGTIRNSTRFPDYLRVAGRYPVVWFGVQATKRSWLEQIDGIASIINDLRSEWPDLFVVFDGWTSPITPRKADDEPIASDVAIVTEILRRAPGVPHINVVGWNSMEKAAVASQIDAFVTNYSTGSLHVARLLQKPGVGHINTRLEKDAQIHYKTICLSEGYVIDNAADAGKRADGISYSLDWRIVSSEIRKILSAR